MPRILLLAIVSLGLALTACADEQPGETGGAEAGTVRGTVLLGPTCPVETLTDPCADQPLGNVRIQVFGPGGDVVATARSDAAGTFSLRLAPGDYTIQAAIEDGPARSTHPVEVTVVEGREVEITVPVDSGIRTPADTDVG